MIGGHDVQSISYNSPVQLMYSCYFSINVPSFKPLLESSRLSELINATAMVLISSDKFLPGTWNVEG